jgi:glutamyl-tRNA synthetase/nondiscriminating glutamyl-tRNA synthetase
LYAQYSTRLIDQGHAYYCFCSAEQLEAERQQAQQAGQQSKYSGRCRSRPREEAARKVAAGEAASVRFKLTEGAFTWNDLVHGSISFMSEVMDDYILVRSDGNPTYNYSVVIDDHLMEITHVIRGDDHISNTPRQLALYRALGWQPPEFAHLSTILGPDRKPLSKRHGATSLASFREMGILPEALRNYLLLLGWSAADGKTEILSPQEQVRQFSLDRITKSPAVFDLEKLYWLNRHYLKESPLRRLAELSVPILEAAGYFAAPVDERLVDWLERIVDAVLKNLDHLGQLPSAARQIFEYDAARVMCGEETRHVAEDAASREVLKAFIPKAIAADGINYEKFREIAKQVQSEIGKKGKELFHPLRVALTGAVSGPELEKLIPIFEEGSKLQLARPVKSTAQRLREFAQAAGL